ncbi:MAG: hypothetical protein AAGD05_11685 [Bacteroidota bacterium]
MSFHAKRVGNTYYRIVLHSYAAGDLVPIPAFVYYAVGILSTIGWVANWKDQQFRKVA